MCQTPDKRSQIIYHEEKYASQNKIMGFIKSPD